MGDIHAHPCIPATAVTTSYFLLPISYFLFSTSYFLPYSVEAIASFQFA